MQPSDDSTLLRQYAENHSDEAFAALVTRHINLVYSVALRCVCDPHLAEEVSQAVFVILARKAAQLRHDKALSSWLFQTTRLTANNFVRGETRRHRREQEAHMQSVLNESGAGIWPGIAPLLDDAVGELNESDRRAIVLRFYEGRSLREVGAALGASEDAAEKRVSRAVERLREFFAKRGVPAGASGLAFAIPANAVQAAPAGLAVTISTAVFTTATLATTTGAAIATKAIAMTALQKTVVTAAIVAIAGAGIYKARQASKLREQLQTLQQQQVPMTGRIQQLERERNDAMQRLASLSIQPAPHLPAPRMEFPLPTADDLQATNLYARFLSDQPKLSVEQLESYLKSNGRNAASLLAAYRTTGDAALLDEAMQKYPDDPQVAFEAAMKKETTPDERRHWLEALKKSDPDNALANYLSARDYFKSGQTDQAVQEFIAASSKPFQDFTSERYQDDTEAYLASGHSVADAKTAAGMQLLLPQLSQVKELGLNMVELAKLYRQAGDDASAQSVLQMAMNLAQHYSTPSPGEPTVSQLVGIHLEGIALNTMDANMPYGDSGQTVQDRLNQLAQQKADVHERNRQAELIFPKMTEQDWINYRDRWLMFGEENAIKWVVNKYGQQ
jgi:RNA polymerase sigma factor (sigma-70 family)